MAKENYVFLIGQVRQSPVFRDDENGEHFSGMMPLMTLRRNIRDNAGNLSPKWDRPIISTANKIMMRQMDKINLHDIVEIKGTITTQNITRGLRCPHCGCIVKQPGTITTINPVYINIRENLNNDTDGFRYLMDCAEISNQTKVIGRVCRDVEQLHTDEGKACAKYQIAINRKLYVEGSEPEDHTDYPYVYSYGRVAEDDIKYIKADSPGTLLYVDGFIHTVKFDQSTFCQNDDCGKEFKFQNQTMNITPYSVEYLRDFADLGPSSHESVYENHMEGI